MWLDRERRLFLCGTCIIVCSLIIHIVCMATHYYVVISVNDIGPTLVRMIAEDKTLLGPNYNSVPDSKLKELNDTLLGMRGSCNFGMWKLCLTFNQSGMYREACISWGNELVFDETTHDAKTLNSYGWIRGAQAMAIVCILVGLPTVALAIVNLVSQSKGDRKRYLHFFIAGGCVLTGVFMLIGDLVLAANYTSVLDAQLEPANPYNKDSVVLYPPQIVEMFREQFHLSWGFGLDIFAVFLAVLGGLVHLTIIKVRVVV